MKTGFTLHENVNWQYFQAVIQRYALFFFKLVHKDFRMTSSVYTNLTLSPLTLRINWWTCNWTGSLAVDISFVFESPAPSGDGSFAWCWACQTGEHGRRENTDF